MKRFLVGRNRLEEGIRKHRKSCPIAITMQRDGFSREALSVNRLYIRLNGVNYNMSEQLQQWVSDFDHGKPVHAIRVFLNKGKAWMETIGITKMRKLRNGKLHEL